MSTVDVDQVVATFTKKLTDSYQLEQEFVDSVAQACKTVLKKYYIYDSPQQVLAATEAASGGKKDKKKDKKPRKKTAYNVFVQEKMPEFKETPHKERMGKIGELWSNVTDEQKGEYQAKADAINAAVAAEAGTEPVTATDAGTEPVTATDAGTTD